MRSDFVIAFYNPVSSKRINQLSEAHEILMKHRSPDTPVILAHNLGRSGERVNVITLACMEPSEVNMLTVVIVGSSQSKKFTSQTVRSGCTRLADIIKNRTLKKPYQFAEKHYQK